jgi:hypothetical protein
LAQAHLPDEKLIEFPKKIVILSVHQHQTEDQDMMMVGHEFLFSEGLRSHRKHQVIMTSHTRMLSHEIGRILFLKILEDGCHNQGLSG